MFCGCENNIKEGKIESGNIKIINVKPNLNHRLYLSDLIQDIHIVPLETKAESLLGDILKMECDSNMYFIQNSQDKLVYIFDKQGGFIKRIGKIGSGPGELQNPESFALNKSTKEICISNNYLSINIYDYFGNIKNKYDCKLFFNGFVICNGYMYIHASKFHNYSDKNKVQCWNLWIKNIVNDEWYTYLPYNSNAYPNGGTYFETKIPFSQYNDSITYHYAFSDTIYSVSKENITPKYKIDFANYNSERNLIDISGDDLLQMIMNDDNVAFYVHDVIENQSFVYFRYILNKYPRSVFYSKNNNNTIEGEFINDIFGAEVRFIQSHGNKLVGYIDPENMNIDESKLPHNYLDIMRNIKKDSNPIIIEVELKNI